MLPLAGAFCSLRLPSARLWPSAGRLPRGFLVASESNVRQSPGFKPALAGLIGRAAGHYFGSCRRDPPSYASFFSSLLHLFCGHGRPDGLQFGDMFVWSIVESRSLFQKGWTRTPGVTIPRHHCLLGSATGGVALKYTYRLYIIHFTLYIIHYTSSTAQGGGGSFKNRKPMGEIGCCESGMAERIH
jgi:hypothetical protein